jgi:hypothetical protein
MGNTNIKSIEKYKKAVRKHGLETFFLFVDNDSFSG